MFLRLFLRWLERRGSYRMIERSGEYLGRYYLLKVFGRAWFLHVFHASDSDYACHDHPWDNGSIILKGGYREHFYDGSYADRKAGDLVLRDARSAHRIEIFPGTEGKVVTLFFHGKRYRKWGFHHPEHGFVPAHELETVQVQGDHYEIVGRLFPRVVWR